PEEFLYYKQMYQIQYEIMMSGTFSSVSRKLDCLLISGSAGSGKSALMAYLASEPAGLNKKTILCFAAASGCRNIALLKRYIAYRLETVL
ncbi:MAG: hypothetical protein II377_00590, partial [Clostridia bacterium]|nr:hypothetical protein [Clostridia bacterium]